MATGLTPEVPNPEWQIAEGRSWAVRPTIMLDREPRRPNDTVKIQNRLRRNGHWSGIGLVALPSRTPITGTIFVDADSPGVAVDIVIDLVSEACTSEGFTPSEILEVVVIPAGYDETDW